MAQPEITTPSSADIARGYQSDDLRGRWIVHFLISFLGSAVVIFIGLWFIMQWFAHYSREADKPRSVVQVNVQLQGPSIQPTEQHDELPSQDLQLMREKEDKVFEALGWKKDEATGDFDPPPAIVAKVAGGQK